MCLYLSWIIITLSSCGYGSKPSLSPFPQKLRSSCSAGRSQVLARVKTETKGSSLPSRHQCRKVLYLSHRERPRMKSDVIVHRKNSLMREANLDMPTPKFRLCWISGEKEIVLAKLMYCANHFTRWGWLQCSGSLLIQFCPSLQGPDLPEA